ncbi:MAG: hypothetical protein ACREP0_11125 [Rhodanobacteraceae bacterium]
MAGIVVLGGSRWPDIAFGIGMALLFLRISWRVLRGAFKILRPAVPQT